MATTKQHVSVKTNTALKVRVENGGRIVIPAEFRSALGLKPGDTILLMLSEPDTLQIRSYPAVIRRAQDLVAKHISPGRSLADELIAERRAEAARE